MRMGTNDKRRVSCVLINWQGLGFFGFSGFCRQVPVMSSQTCFTFRNIFYLAVVLERRLRTRGLTTC